jgi:hypothetical protein
MELDQPFCAYCDYEDIGLRNRSSFYNHLHIMYSCDVCHIQNTQDDAEQVE